MTENELSTIIIGCAIEVHRRLGAGLLERAYQECLMYELKLKDLKQCPYCNYEIALSFSFCPNCGAKQENNSSEETTKEENTESQENENSNESSQE